MKVYLAGHWPWAESGLYDLEINQKICILESFYYIKDWMLPYIQNYWDFMLDSGAFTFMMNTNKKLNWVEYLESYAHFIRDNKIGKFFELDIDSIVGYKKVLEYRDRLEQIVGSPCIPVWHRSRGKDEFLKLVNDYEYISIGGIAIRHIEKKEFKFFKWFIDVAHAHSCKIHGLGYSSIPGLKKYNFDSVDSTSWLYGNRGGFLYQFKNNDLVKLYPPKGTRVKGREVALHNFREWIKFQRWADVNL